MAGIILFAAIPGARAAGTGGLTIADLLQRCQELEVTGRNGVGDSGRKPEPGPDGTYCIGHIEGFREALRLGIRLHKQAGFKGDWKTVVRICLPGKQASSESLARIFTHWARAHLVHGDKPATVGIYEALRQAYPCVDTYR